MKLKKRWIILFVLVVTLTICSIPEMIHKNDGVSETIGSVRDGKLKNGYLIPFESKNFKYFSQFSYFIMDNAYVHSTVYKTMMDAYLECETTCPGKIFAVMECSDKDGGGMFFHWTHQNGTSVDFMTPKKRGDVYNVWPNQLDLLHYLLKFNEKGQLSIHKKTEIDFETMARHLIALDKAAKANGIRIRKVLFHTDLHDELFNTSVGEELRARDIRIVERLNDLVNRFHDDHYHVDFDGFNGEK